MNSTTDYRDPQTRYFADEIKDLSAEELQQRYKDIEIYLKTGIRPLWTVIVDSNTLLNMRYWYPEDLVRYRRILVMELLDRCKSFELIPKLKFKF
jgi:hypothetical protein